MHTVVKAQNHYEDNRLVKPRVTIQLNKKIDSF